MEFGAESRAGEGAGPLGAFPGAAGLPTNALPGRGPQIYKCTHWV